MARPGTHGNPPMQPTLPNDPLSVRVPGFRLTEAKPPGLGAILLALVIALSLLYPVAFVRWHLATLHLNSDPSSSSRAAGTTVKKDADDDDDDPNQIDTIALGDPADAPVPARRGDHVSPVHPTILVQLPRFGEKTGLIPDTPAGRLLYRWLAAFNQASSPMLDSALPNIVPDASTIAQMDLRQRTGGFYLLSAKEVQPGVLVFRLRDQTPSGTEVLGTLQLRADSNPPQIASFSLRAVLAARKGASTGDVTGAAATR